MAELLKQKHMIQNITLVLPYFTVNRLANIGLEIRAVQMIYSSSLIYEYTRRVECLSYI